MEIESSRRAVLAAGAAGLAATAAGCSVYGKSDEPAAATETVIGKAAEVPVGGTKIFAKAKVVVSQPSAGQFTALTAVCTHQGCTVNKVADGKLICPCHSSAFKVTDGSVVDPPAERPLKARKVKVSGENLVLLPD